MAEQLLDEADVGAVFEHECRAGVAEEMATAALADFGRVDVVPRELRQAVQLEGVAHVGEEDRAAVRREREFRPRVVEVAVDPTNRAFADRDHAILFPFALAHAERAALLVEVVELQVREFHPAHARRVEDFQDRAIAQARADRSCPARRARARLRPS